MQLVSTEEYTQGQPPQASARSVNYKPKFFGWADVNGYLTQTRQDAAGKSLSNIREGIFYDKIAGQIISNNYDDVTVLSKIYSVNSVYNSGGGGSEGGGGGWSNTVILPEDIYIKTTYRALRLNTHISRIDMDQLPHTPENLEHLLFALLDNPNLPLLHLSLKSVVNKNASGYNSLFAKYIPGIIKIHTHLEVLTLQGNQLGPNDNDCLRAIGAAIAQNRSLTQVSLSYNNLSYDQCSTLLDQLESNTSIIDLRLNFNAMHDSEVKNINSKITALTQRNQAIRDHIFKAIESGNVHYIRDQLDKGMCINYTLNGRKYKNKYMLTFIDELKKRINKQKDKILWKISCRVRIKSKDSERQAFVINCEELIKNLDAIILLLQEQSRRLKEEGRQAYEEIIKEVKFIEAAVQSSSDFLSTHPTNKLFEAIESGDIEKVKEMLNANDSRNEPTTYTAALSFARELRAKLTEDYDRINQQLKITSKRETPSQKRALFNLEQDAFEIKMILDKLPEIEILIKMKQEADTPSKNIPTLGT